MQQVRNILKQAETQNRQLLENIDFVKKQGPLVKEKMRLENGNMKQMESALMEVRMADCLKRYLSKILVVRVKVSVWSEQVFRLSICYKAMELETLSINVK